MSSMKCKKKSKISSVLTLSFNFRIKSTNSDILEYDGLFRIRKESIDDCDFVFCIILSIFDQLRRNKNKMMIKARKQLFYIPFHFSRLQVKEEQTTAIIWNG